MTYQEFSALMLGTLPATVEVEGATIVQPRFVHQYVTSEGVTVLGVTQLNAQGVRVYQDYIIDDPETPIL